jgi:plastocyanin
MSRFTPYLGILLTASMLGQTPPAPTQDRVGFPANYRETFVKLLTFDRPDNGQIRVIWANQIAARAPFWEPFPYGSVILFESWTSRRDENNAILRDESGRFIPNALTTLFVKRKEPGFGEAYAQNRNGEWEYVAYRPDGSVQTAPQNSGNCAVCHLEAGPQNDWTFRRDRFAQGATGAAPQATMTHYTFLPNDIKVKKGETLTWYNDDEITHQIALPELMSDSKVMNRGATFSHKFDVVGTWDVRCTIHPGMRAKVTVEP